MIRDCYEYYLWTTKSLRQPELKQRKPKLKKGNKNEQ